MTIERDSIQKLWELHGQVLRLASEGVPVGTIAEVVGMKEVEVVRIVSGDLARSRMQDMRGESETAT